MDSRRHKPFRKLPPNRRRGRSRPHPTRWETLVDDPHDLDDDHDPDDELPLPPPPRIPAPRTGSHDQDDPQGHEPLPDVYDEEPTRRPVRRWVPLAGTVSLVLVGAAIVAGALVLTGFDTPAEPVRKPVAFDPPVPVPANTEYVQTVVLTSGALRVDHWIRSKPLLFRLTVRLPEVPELGPGTVTLRRLAVVADGLELETPTTLGRRSVRRFSFVGSGTVHVSYVLRGAIRTDGTGTESLVRLTSLPLSYDPLTANRVVAVSGAAVLGLECSAPPALPLPCGQNRGGRWSVTLDGERRADQVSAELRLPAETPGGANTAKE